MSRSWNGYDAHAWKAVLRIFPSLPRRAANIAVVSSPEMFRGHEVQRLSGYYLRSYELSQAIGNPLRCYKQCISVGVLPFGNKRCPLSPPSSWQIS